MSEQWRFPVGDPLDFARADTSHSAGYRVNRGVSAGARPHQGVDLSNRCAGGAVHAAAAGLVVLAQETDPGNGYGCHVVLAHQLPDRGLVYSVYAHLAPGSLAVAAGDLVGVGDLLGRVGQSGRATSPHLHFEVRRPDDPEQRWERAPVLDPIAFVAAHLATAMTPRAEP